MKTITQLLFVIGSGCAALAQTQIVVPGGLANTEGNSSSSGPFAIGSTRFLQVYSASEFASLGAPTGIIAGVSFRLDSTVAERTVAVWQQGVGIVLSTTDRSPDALSPVLDDNAGTDTTLVFLSTPFGILADVVPGVEPQPFSLHISFNRGAFTYVPSMGNLAMYITAAGGTRNLILDSERQVGDGVGSVYSDFLNPNSGTVDTLGLVTRFDIIPIPEPTVWSLLLLTVAIPVIVRCWRAVFRNSTYADRASRI